MLREFVQSIVDLAGKATAATIVNIPGNPRQALLVHGEHREEINVLPPLRAHKVYTAEDLAAAAVLGSAPALFHSEKEVVLLLDHNDRRERVTMPLTLADTYLVLDRLTEQACAFQPKQLANLLKIELAGTIQADDLIRSLRKLKWRSGSEVRQEFSHGRESLGKDIEAELQADVELPEFVEIDTPVYQNPGEDRTFPVKCLLDPQPFEQKIAFRPLPGELEEALKHAQGSLRERLQEALPDVPIYYGVP